MNLQPTLTESERIALCGAVDMALSDQREYMQNGSPHKDYGDEWPDTAVQKAEMFEHCSTAMYKFYLPTMAESCSDMAKSLRASGLEYKQQEESR